MNLERDHLKNRNNNKTINRDEQKATIKNLEDGLEQLQKNYEIQSKMNAFSQEIL